MAVVTRYRHRPGRAIRIVGVSMWLWWLDAKITGPGKLVLAVGAALLLLIGQLVGRFELAVVALLIGVADGTVRGAYHRALARKARAIGR